MNKDSTAQRLDELIDQGTQLIRRYGSGPMGLNAGLDSSDQSFSEWQAGSVSYLVLIFGPKHSHVTYFQKNCDYPDNSDIAKGLGVLRAAKKDVENGYFSKLEDIVAAGVFADFLEMAQYLLGQGYKDAAATLGGGVMEEGLRKLCIKNGMKPGKDIASCNQKLTESGIYNPLWRSKIVVWEKIRNNAAHGKFGEYSANDVKEMLNGILDFLEKHK